MLVLHCQVVFHASITHFDDYSVWIRCLEGLFDTWGTFGVGFNGDLEKGGPVPIGAQKANLSAEVQMYMEEVALNEQVGNAQFNEAL